MEPVNTETASASFALLLLLVLLELMLLLVLLTLLELVATLLELLELELLVSLGLPQPASNRVARAMSGVRLRIDFVFISIVSLMVLLF